MDYRKLLGKVESAVLPYSGGGTVDAPSRRLRVTQPVAPGWWRFEVKGREATAREPASPEGMEALPRVRGHVWGTRLVREGAVAEPLALMPEEEEPPRLSPVTARRWHDGTLLFEGVEFEGEAEETARRALEEDRALGDARGVSASLRAAFGFAVLESVSRGTGIPFAPVEARARVLDVAREGREEAERCLRRLAEERARFIRMQAELEARREAETRARMHETGTPEVWRDAEGRELGRALSGRERERWETLHGEGARTRMRQEPGTARSPWDADVREAAWAGSGQVTNGREAWEARRDASARASGRTPGTRDGRGHTRQERGRAESEVGARVERALDKAGARLLDHRRMGDGLLEVVYTFMGERFVTVVEAATLRVRDAGVCLAGADNRVTLESLPSVLKEAIDTDALVITRHL
ncbi:hypothetical protein COCOR_01506 [Corallococcus coralloides DSM 2259]|uniref:Uncharacterized protein n=1 Tax=Corallococcus coralloides (strain ATCC 25202 / DSM 2259 / NBRC 100086 / M2) TaxID=1144275 RepID=H8MWS9_CORCM|nr:hypothetical protein [Corallococcus coralloides]AFE04111.1 hypothetical protein COCOR_01506 [Corallococcus coralloides DSM 2259]